MKSFGFDDNNKSVYNFINSIEFLDEENKINAFNQLLRDLDVKEILDKVIEVFVNTQGRNISNIRSNHIALYTNGDVQLALKYYSLNDNPQFIQITPGNWFLGNLGEESVPVDVYTSNVDLDDDLQFEKASLINKTFDIKSKKSILIKKGSQALQFKNAQETLFLIFIDKKRVNFVHHFNVVNNKYTHSTLANTEYSSQLF